MSKRKKTTKEEMLDYICGKDKPSVDGEIIIGYALDDGEDYTILDEEETILDEIEMTLYYLQGIQNDLMRLVARLRAEEDNA